ncbi:MAG: phosphoribosylformylglycinamidine synthase subunit PurL [Fidelibacterota bacterium]
MTFTNDTIDFASLSKREIEATLKRHSIPLTVDEILTIQNEILRRPPSTAECVLWSIQGSEHSSYKSSRSHLKQFPTDGPTVILGPKEDAGIVAIAEDSEGNRYGIVMSHESHNHPSQIVPYEGAATGIGGNVRDVACMGAMVIAVADGLRFGHINSPKTKWIHEGVVAGIAGYANPIGVPNIAGDLYYDEGYNENCLVTVVTLGIVREDEIIHSRAPAQADGYDLVLVGKPTDNSGFGGASFASLELNEEEKEIKKGAVQEPNAFLERHLLKATYALFGLLRDRAILNKVGFKDLGAGGIACASVELADNAGYGAELFLHDVHVGMNHLHSSIVLCSETQERFMWVSHPEVTPLILQHYNKTYDLPNISRGAEAKVIGRIRGDGRYVVHADGHIIVDAPAAQVTKGFLYHRLYKAPEEVLVEPPFPEPEDYQETLLTLLAHENIASRQPVFESYDKQVQGRTRLEAGEADAGVMQPFDDDRYPEEIQKVGIALSVDHNPRYGKIDPYWCAVNAVVESVRNVAAVGATPQAVTDCLCFGNPEKESQMWQFAQAVKGVAHACTGIHLKEYPGFPIPVIAGNVSFYNESRHGAIPPSPVVSCLGRLKDASRAVTPWFKAAGSVLIMIGERKDECGGSVYYSLHEQLGANVPKPVLPEVEKQIYAVTDAIDRGLIYACHDISEGGVAVALAEMCFSPRGMPSNGSPGRRETTGPADIGCQVRIPGRLRMDKKLFGETGGFILEVPHEHAKQVKKILEEYQLTASTIGETTLSPILNIDRSIRLPLDDARQAWLEGLRTKLHWRNS